MDGIIYNQFTYHIIIILYEDEQAQDKSVYEVM
jgi:hypothetical protein